MWLAARWARWRLEELEVLSRQWERLGLSRFSYVTLLTFCQQSCSPLCLTVNHQRRRSVYSISSPNIVIMGDILWKLNLVWLTCLSLCPTLTKNLDQDEKLVLTACPPFFGCCPSQRDTQANQGRRPRILMKSRSSSRRGDNVQVLWGIKKEDTWSLLLNVGP